MTKPMKCLHHNNVMMSNSMLSFMMFSNGHFFVLSLSIPSALPDSPQTRLLNLYPVRCISESDRTSESLIWPCHISCSMFSLITSSRRLAGTFELPRTFSSIKAAVIQQIWSEWTVPWAQECKAEGRDDDLALTHLNLEFPRAYPQVGLQVWLFLSLQLSHRHPIGR